MTGRLTTAFETLANRGEERGAEMVLERAAGEIGIPLALRPSYGLTRPRGRPRRPLAAAVAGFVTVALMGVLAILLFTPGQNQDQSVSPATGLGADGTHFALDDPAWALVQAWEVSGGTFSLYERGYAQVTVLTGSVAAEVLPNLEQPGSTRTLGDSRVVEHRESEGVAFSWVTGADLEVVVIFGQMGETEALQLAEGIQPIDSEAWSTILASASVTPTTVAP